MIQIEARHLVIVKSILNQYPYEFYVYGSRAKQTARRFSDLDLLHKEDIPLATKALIREQFEESDLPFTVDLVDWNHCTAEFQQQIARDLVKIA